MEKKDFRIVTLACKEENIVKAHKMDKKLLLEEQVKALQNHFGAIVSTVKHLKSSVDNLKSLVEKNEFKEILEAQKIVEEVIVANSDAIHRIKGDIAELKHSKNGSRENTDENTIETNECIKEVVKKQQMIDKDISANADTVKRLDREIKSILKDKTKKEANKQEVEDAIKQLETEILKLKQSGKGGTQSEEIQKPSENQKTEKKCKYFNVGYCKYNGDCKFIHPKEVCQKYQQGQCNGNKCPNRHPKACKWFKAWEGCRRREACHFSHDTLVCDGQENQAQKNETIKFNCVSCKHEWKDRNCVVSHLVNSTQVYFCLNCDDWVQDKSKVLDNGWSLFDQYGNPSKLV